MSRQKKVKIFLVVVVVLYVLSAGYGLSRDDGKMGQAMATVNEKVAAARRDIKAEMDKPFILRIFGSLFSMEGNSLEKLKRELPETLKSAMPEILTRFTHTEPPSPVVCVGMRLVDALLDLQSANIEVEHIVWSFDDTVEEGFLKLGGTVLAAQQTESGGAQLVIQYAHRWRGEQGLGATEAERRQHLQETREAVLQAREQPFVLYDWMIDEDLPKVQRAVAQGFPIESWCDSEIAYGDQVATQPEPEPGREPEFQDAPT